MPRLGGLAGQGQIEQIDDAARVSPAVWPQEYRPRKGLGRCDRPVLGHPPETYPHAFAVADDLFAQQLRNCPNQAWGEFGRSRNSEVVGVAKPHASRPYDNRGFSVVADGDSYAACATAARTSSD